MPVRPTSAAAPSNGRRASARTAVARGPLEREGQVAVQGELWRAVAEGAPVADGDLVRVVGVDGLTLRVVKAEEPAVVKAGEPGGTP